MNLCDFVLSISLNMPYLE